MSTIGVSTADGDRFFDRADPEIRVDGRGERPAELEAFALDRAEAGQREYDRVGARPQVDDLVLSGPIRNDRPRLLDQSWAGRFNRHARQNGAGRVLDDAGNRPLGVSGRGKDDDRPEHE
jgi:hypothetical protein